MAAVGEILLNVVWLVVVGGAVALCGYKLMVLDSRYAEEPEESEPLVGVRATTKLPGYEPDPPPAPAVTAEPEPQPASQPVGPVPA